MKIVNELESYRPTDVADNIHASTRTGKMRISSFTYTATEADTQLIIAYIPAGRNRSLPVFCRIETTGVTGAYTVGMGAYTDAAPSVPRHEAVVDNLSTSQTATDNTVQAFLGPVEGVQTHSLEDIPVIVTGTFPVGCTVRGVFVFNGT